MPHPQRPSNFSSSRFSASARLVALTVGCAAAFAGASAQSADTVAGVSAATDAVAVVQPLHLPSDPIPCERIPLGQTDDYKPCIARMPDGELLLTAFHQNVISAPNGIYHGGRKILEQMLIFRSRDGGRTWSGPEKPNLLGREPYLTILSDGTIFITTHLLPEDVRNEWHHTCGFLHRSNDGGRTWTSIRVESGSNEFKQDNKVSRNLVQLADGSLLMGVDYFGPTGGPCFIWRSTDNGETWDKTQKCEPKNFLNMEYGFFGGETWLWVAKSGKIWALNRVDSSLMPIQGRGISNHGDADDHFILYSSRDRGRTFDRGGDFGDYGEMYMSILRLKDRRLLLTFTVRSQHPPLGVRAIPGIETDEGFQFDFDHDRIMLDTKTPLKYTETLGEKNPGSGGGFGPTVQLNDGTLVTSYSYRGQDAKTHLEVVRWRLPAGR